MKFSEWSYTRPDYAEVRNKITGYKNEMLNASSYRALRDAWLNIKKEIEYMEFQEEIIYIRHLCGIDYQYSLQEIEIQNREDPLVFTLRDECNAIAAASQYRHELEQEFGKQVYEHMDSHSSGMDPNSLKLQSEELELKLQYRKMMAEANRDDDALYRVLRKLIEIRCELADSLGYHSYKDLGYHIQCRYDYDTNDITDFRRHIQMCVTPAVAEIKDRGISFDNQIIFKSKSEGKSLRLSR